LLYNANHTGGLFGNDAIGCAVAEDPLGFSNESKQPAPPIDQNRTRLESAREVIAGDFGPKPDLWRYTTDVPEGHWQSPEFDDSGRAEGFGAFGHPARPEPRGGCRVPREWRILYRDGEEWEPVTGASAYGTARDQMNRVTFDPVVTDGLRLEALLKEAFCGGILE